MQTGTYVPIFMPPEPLPCPDCNEPHTIFFDHCLVGWLCRECIVRVQAACEGLAKFKAPVARTETDVVP